MHTGDYVVHSDAGTGREGYLKLNLGRAILLLLVAGLGLVLILRHDRRSAGRDTARGIGGNSGARSIDYALFLARSLGPLDFLHVGHPEVSSSLASPDNGTYEDHDVSEN